LGLSSDGTKFEHAVIEVYLPQLRKWVLIDCDFNIGYKNTAGEWLNAIEIRECWQRFNRLELGHAANAKDRRTLGEQIGLEVVSLGEAGQLLRESSMQANGAGMNLWLFEWILFDCRNNFLSGDYPIGHPDAVRQYYIGPQDTPPPIASNSKSANDSTSHLLYPDVGSTAVQLSSLDYDSYEILLGTQTPGFDFFELRTDNEDWRRLSKSRLSLRMVTQRIEIRTVNSSGVRGPVRVIKVTQSD
jgi:hypothetical protein